MKKDIAIIIMFVVLTGLLMALIPMERKQQLVEKYGELAENAETDERSAYILEHAEEYPDEILNLYYDGSENYDYVYNYFTHKNAYDTMSFTAEELNSETVPPLYMDDVRWGYEKINQNYIKTSGCLPVSLTMAALYLNRDGETDPVKISRIAEENYEVPAFGGVDTMNISDLAGRIGLSAKEYQFQNENPPCEEQFLKDIIDSGKVCLAGIIDEYAGGHAVIVSAVENGMVRINDPASREKTETPVPFEEFQGELYYVWELSSAK